jgi:hypothetical protein
MMTSISYIEMKIQNKLYFKNQNNLFKSYLG